MSPRELYVGLMSGTSLDGIDAVLVDLSAARPRLLAASHSAFDATLRAELLALHQPAGNELERGALLGNELARRYAAAVREVLARGAQQGAAVRAIGCHGQTVRHRPVQGYTIQLGNAALLAELTGIAVVSDFRSRDIAAGGQGAPLVPAFHAAVFSDPNECRAVLNVGGIANLSWLPKAGGVSGFDTGPGNGLLDLWAGRHLGQPYDDDGRWAAGGEPDGRLLARLFAEPYFAAAPPKSTGRDLFNEDWLAARLSASDRPQDVQAALLELSARSIAEACARHCPGLAQLIVCGGGARNGALRKRLAELVRPAALETSEAHGIDPMHVEACAFAWLAQQALAGRAAGLPAVTGARAARVLGAIYPR